MSLLILSTLTSTLSAITATVFATTIWLDLVELFALPLVGLGAYGMFKITEWQRRSKAITGREGLLGAKGIVKRGFKPRGQQYRGKVLVFGEWWDAVADAAIPVGATVVVESADGFILTVREQSDEPISKLNL